MEKGFQSTDPNPNIMSELRFDGKVAVVTGAGNGLGKAYATLLAARGAKVVVNDLGGGMKGEGASAKTADLVVEEIKQAGGIAVANYDSVVDGDKIIQTALDAFGTIDIVVNNAGILRDMSLKKMTDKDFKLIHDVHMMGTYKTTKAAWNVMQEKKYGRIINVTSAAGLYGNFGQTNYSAAKLGILGFTFAVAREGASKNIHANCIAPLAASRMTETVMPKEVLASLSPKYVAPLVGFLAHESCEETGQIFEVGGGWIAPLRWQRANGGAMPNGAITPEGVKQVWDKTMNFENDAEYPESVNDGMGKVMEAQATYSKL